MFEASPALLDGWCREGQKAMFPMFMGSQGVTSATGFLTDGTLIAGRLHVVSLDVLEDVGLHFGAARALQTHPVTVQTL
jgi:hypothetical protein